MWKTNSKYYTAYYCNNINSYLITNHYLLGVELLPFGVTFFSCLFINMEYGILIGVAVHMFILSYMSNKPRLEVTISVCLQHCETKFKLFKNIQPNAVIRTSQGKEATDEKIIVKVDSNLYFPGVERFRSALNKAAVGHRSQHLIIDLSNLKAIDYSSLKVSFKNVVSLKTMRNSKRNCTVPL